MVYEPGRKRRAGTDRLAFLPTSSTWGFARSARAITLVGYFESDGGKTGQEARPTKQRHLVCYHIPEVEMTFAESQAFQGHGYIR